MNTRTLARRTAACLALLLAACSQKAVNPQVEAALGKFDQEMQSLDAFRAKLVGPEGGARKDFRGLTIEDDLNRWFLPAETRGKIKDLRERAAASNYANDAEQLLSQARRLAADDVTRAKNIWVYWNSNLPAPYWRSYWHAVFADNGVTEEAPDSMLVSIEQKITSSLNAGDFANAAKGEEELNAVFDEAFNRAAGRINVPAEKLPAFAPRKTPCPIETTPASGEKPKLIRGESIDAFYPKAAIDRGETGSVVLRARVDAKGCATGVVIQVHSGVPSLDTAALDWFETARFAPAAKNGKPVESELAWKLRFTLK